MTIITDTRVVRLQRTAARTGHQHSADERIVEEVTDELVTAADVVSLPPGSLITLQRGPGAGLTEEGSVLNAARDEIGGVAGGQTTSVSFDSEDAGATAASIFVTELDFSVALTASGQYAINYKTFQIKTYDPVPTAPGSRILITYAWAPIREYLEWVPEDLDPDLEAFGVGPHQGGGSGGARVEAGLHIELFDDDGDGYQEINVDTQSLAGRGLVVVPTDGGASNALAVDLDQLIEEGCSININEDGDGYKIFSVDVSSLAGTGLSVVEGPDGCLQLSVSDGYGVIHIRKIGSEADNYPFNSVYSLDGYEYVVGQDRLLVTVNGILQSPGYCYVERSTTTIEFVDQRDMDAVIDIWILPGALGSVSTGTTNLQNAYNNSASGAKNIIENDGQITFTQTLSTGSALRLITSNSSNVTPSLVVDQSGTGEGARVKSVDGTNASLLIQKDTVARNTVVDTTVIERSTSHIIGAQTGIGSGLLTRLEDSGGNLFSASRLVTGTEDATDSSEKTYLSIELSDDGVLTEHARLTSTGRFALNTISPDALLHVQGDGYFSAGVEIAGKAILGSDNTIPPINIPVFTTDPSSLESGDLWATDDGGTRQLKLRIGSVTYSVTLT